MTEKSGNKRQIPRITLMTNHSEPQTVVVRTFSFEMTRTLLHAGAMGLVFRGRMCWWLQICLTKARVGRRLLSAC